MLGEYPGWVYGRRLIFVSVRTNKRHHHHLRETTSGGLCGLVIRSEVENEMSMKFVACVYSIFCFCKNK